ncbi:MAG: hypothetical protein R6T96_04470 [Longimicrobiales bacterium]
MKDNIISDGPRLAVLALAFLAWVGCGGEDQGGSAGGAQGEMPAAAQPMSQEVQELINLGNEAQRAGRYDEAMTLYREGMALAPDHPVPQFGALMAAMALGDEALTDSLSAILAETSPDLLEMLNPDGSMGGGMPANPHVEGMPGGMTGDTPAMPPGSGMTPMEGLPEGHPTLYEVEPGDTVPPDTAGGDPHRP